MEVEYTEGYVTFADILGWKGIWQSKKNGESVNSLLAIRNEMNKSIYTIQKRYFSHLIDNELSMYLNKEMRKEILEKIGRTNYSIDEIINTSFNKKKDRDNFQKEFDEYSINISIELISDTFVITSSGGKRKYELLFHSQISQRLVIACLKYGFLIRGATSYGKYYKQELVFVGPAIDDSASWHEIGDEIGIYFTPKALLTINKGIDIKIGETSFNRIVMRCKPMLKVNTFDTLILDWSEGEENFKKIISEYDTILPTIHKKVLFSMSRLEELKTKDMI